MYLFLPSPFDISKCASRQRVFRCSCPSHPPTEQWEGSRWLSCAGQDPPALPQRVLCVGQGQQKVYLAVWLSQALLPQHQQHSVAARCQRL